MPTALQPPLPTNADYVGFAIRIPVGNPAYSVLQTYETLADDLKGIRWEGILGLSPQDIHVLTGAPIIEGNPLTYAQFTTTPYPAIFVEDGLRVLKDGQLAPITQGSGTLADGRPWYWSCSVELYTGGALPSVPVLNTNTGTYVGNGTTQMVNVGFDLTVANSGLFLWPKSGGGGGGCYIQTGMPGAASPGSEGTIANRVALTATGFTVTSGSNDPGNINNVTYAWFAFSNPDGTYVKMGSYVGTGVAQTVSIASPFPTVPTDLFVVGRSAVYWNGHFPTGDSVYLNSDGEQAFAGYITNGVTSVSANQFAVGTGQSVNIAGHTRYWAAIDNIAPFSNVFRSGTFLGANGGSVTSLPWSPFAVVTQMIRDAFQTPGWVTVAGVQVVGHSSSYGLDGVNVADDTAAIVSLDANGFTTGIDAAPTGFSIGWFALKGGLSQSGNGGSGLGCPVNGIINTAYSAQLAASGGTAPYIYILTQGALPNGLVLSPNGLIYGTPILQGTFTYTIEALDVTFTVVQTFSCSITIGASGAAPIATPVIALFPGPGCGNDLPIAS